MRFGTEKEWTEMNWNNFSLLNLYFHEIQHDSLLLGENAQKIFLSIGKIVSWNNCIDQIKKKTICPC